MNYHCCSRIDEEREKRGVSNLGRLMAKYNFAQGVDSDTDAQKGIRREKACK